MIAVQEILYTCICSSRVAVFVNAWWIVVFVDVVTLGVIMPRWAEPWGTRTVVGLCICVSVCLSAGFLVAR